MPGVKLWPCAPPPSHPCVCSRTPTPLPWCACEQRRRLTPGSRWPCAPPPSHLTVLQNTHPAHLCPACRRAEEAIDAGVKVAVCSTSNERAVSNIVKVRACLIEAFVCWRCLTSSAACMSQNGVLASRRPPFHLYSCSAVAPSPSVPTGHAGRAHRGAPQPAEPQAAAG